MVFIRAERGSSCAVTGITCTISAMLIIEALMERGYTVTFQDDSDAQSVAQIKEWLNRMFSVPQSEAWQCSQCGTFLY